MDSVLAWLGQRETFAVVQIGAYIGDTQSDPLYGFLRGTLPGHPDRLAVLVEPVPQHFEELQCAYRGLSNVRLHNVAITEAASDRNIYRLASGVDPTAHGFPAWLTQTSSLRPDWITSERSGQSQELKHFWQQHSTAENVRCWTFDQLLDQNGLTHVDLLQIDAEGYDYTILRTIDLSRLHPLFINYERQGMQEDEAPCRALLSDAGYVLFDWGIDTLAVALGGVRTEPPSEPPAL
jgi:FkbM family methyltransferase